MVTDSLIVRRPVVRVASINSNSIRNRMTAVHVEEQPVQVERKVTPGSGHTNLFILFSLYNVFVGLFLLLVKVNSNNVNIALEFLLS